MLNAVIFGAGNIGRGFIAELLYKDGYKINFIDVNHSLINEINARKCYYVEHVYGDKSEIIQIDNITAIDGNDFEMVSNEITQCDLLVTCVGVRALPYIVKALAFGLMKRFETNKTPVNIIICENLLDADIYLKELLAKELGEKEVILEMVGFIEASIGRMVPTPNQDTCVLDIKTESYPYIPINKDAIKGELKKSLNFLPFSPFSFFIERKLFLHNMSHALCAWLGDLKEYNYIYEAIHDISILYICQTAMYESAIAISKKHAIPFPDISAHIDDLIYRFSNKALGDPISRVGNDVLRKLNKNDRVVGAINLCIKQDVPYGFICVGVAAGLIFLKDPSGKSLEETIKETDFEKVLIDITGIESGSRPCAFIKELYEMLLMKKSIDDIILKSQAFNISLQKKQPI